MQFRNTWQRLYQQARKLLENSTNLIDITTWQLILHKKIKIFPFHQLSKEDSALFAYTFPEDAQLLTSHPPSKSSMDKLNVNYQAIIFDNRIYLSSKIKNVQSMKKAIVHEANHFLNDSRSHYDTPAQIFQEELRAEVAERLSTNKPLTRYRLKQIAKVISHDYNVPLPSRILFPSGIYYQTQAAPQRNHKMR